MTYVCPSVNFLFFDTKIVQSQLKLLCYMNQFSSISQVLPTDMDPYPINWWRQLKIPYKKYGLWFKTAPPPWVQPAATWHAWSMWIVEVCIYVFRIEILNTPSAQEIESINASKNIWSSLNVSTNSRNSIQIIKK